MQNSSKLPLLLLIAFSFVFSSVFSSACFAQRGAGKKGMNRRGMNQGATKGATKGTKGPNQEKPKGSAMDVPEHPQDIGDAGVAWYTTWASGLEEAKRSNRPIFFMSAATTCSGIPGVF